MMMLDYKGGSGGQESGKKWLHNKLTFPKYVIRKLLSNLYFCYLKFFDFMWYLCWVSFKLQVHYNKDHYVIVQSLLSNTCDLFSRIFKILMKCECK